MGHFIKNALIRIAWVVLYIVAYTVYEIELPNSVNDFIEFFFIFVIFLSFYFGLSVIGWLFIGVPTHWLIQRLAQGKTYYYPLAAMFFSFLLLVFNTLEVALVLGIAALLQASVFATLLGGNNNYFSCKKNHRNRRHNDGK